MIKILLKTVVLLFIVFSVYFIVHPAACSNFLAGRETRMSEPSSAASDARRPGPREEQSSVSASPIPSQDAPSQIQDPAQTEAVQGAQAPAKGIIDTNTMQEEGQISYSQDEIDEAVASRYVELEREYANGRTLGKDAAREISFIVKDEFEMSPAEWESFLTRATEKGLFARIRRDMPPAAQEE